VIRAIIAGSGSSIPPNRITNDMLATIMETSDEWIRERSGVEVRQYVDRGTSTLGLSIPAARQAIESAGLAPGDIDMVIYATNPDYYVPGGCLPAALGHEGVPPTSASSAADSLRLSWRRHVRSGLAKNVLLVGGVHSAFMPFREASWARRRRRHDAHSPGRVGLQHAEPAPRGALRRRRRGGDRAGVRG
jgi:3-oxoacyl-[acyl-carrier-protein] synthase-3